MDSLGVPFVKNSSVETLAKKLGTVSFGNTSTYIDKSLTECLPFPST